MTPRFGPAALHDPVSWHDTTVDEDRVQAALLRSANDSRISGFSGGDMRPDAARQRRMQRQAERQARRSRRALIDTVRELAPVAVVLLVLIAIGIFRKF